MDRTAPHGRSGLPVKTMAKRQRTAARVEETMKNPSIELPRRAVRRGEESTEEIEARKDPLRRLPRRSETEEAGRRFHNGQIGEGVERR
jgi:hypothetical protein